MTTPTRGSIVELKPDADAPPGGHPEIPPKRSRRPLIAALSVLVAAGGAFGAHAVLTAGQESTDDAQVEADVVAVAPRVGGMLRTVRVRDNQVVKKGDLIASIDDADYAARVKQAEAELATATARAAAADAQAQVVEATAKGGFASAKATLSWSAAGVQSAAAQIAAARAGLQRAQAEADQADLDLKRAKALQAEGAIAAAQLEAAQTAHDTKHAALAQATAQLAAAREAKETALGRVGEATGRLHQSAPIGAQIAAAHANAELAHARVQAATAALDLARLQLAYTKILAPADGKVSKLSAREGAMVAPGQAVAQLVPAQTYVVANFKETQVGAMHPGQRVLVEVDAYSGRKLLGTVESISGGTGARFSLLPADNASGNFVKVVQRVPVRIMWVSPPRELTLRAGLSCTVTVYTRG
jgi:membrane fusion protein (multidrug efflux system)